MPTRKQAAPRTRSQAKRAAVQSADPAPEDAPAFEPLTLQFADPLQVADDLEGLGLPPEVQRAVDFIIRHFDVISPEIVAAVEWLINEWLRAHA